MTNRNTRAAKAEIKRHYDRLTHRNTSEQWSCYFMDAKTTLANPFKEELPS